MYRQSPYYYQWYDPNHNNWYNNNWNNNWGNNWNPHYYQWNSMDWNNNHWGNNWGNPHDGNKELKDYGPNPFVINIEEATKRNNTFRTALWTGKHLQVTLMSINVGEDIGLEIHPTLDQFLRIEDGQGLVQMGASKDRLDFQEYVYDDYAFVIPAGTWHNVINTGNTPLKLYSIYAPPQHPRGTVHQTKANAMAAEAIYS